MLTNVVAEPPLMARHGLFSTLELAANNCRLNQLLMRIYMPPGN